MTLRVLVAGHLCLDLTPGLAGEVELTEGALHVVGPLRVRAGGCVANTGRALARLGADVAVSAAVGEDQVSELLIGLLHAEGLDVAHLQRVPAAASTTIVLQPPGRDRTFWHHAGANDLFAVDHLDPAGFDVVHVGYPSLLPSLRTDAGMPLARLFQRCREAGALTSLDVAVVDPRTDPGPDWATFFRRVLPRTDVFTPSLDDLNSALRWGLPLSAEGLADAARRLLDLGAGVVMVTGGAAGAVVAESGQAPHHVAAVPIDRVVTTTGAGDTATAGFLTAYARGKPAVEAAEAAMSLAGRFVAGRG